MKSQAVLTASLPPAVYCVAMIAAPAGRFSDAGGGSVFSAIDMITLNFCCSSRLRTEARTICTDMSSMPDSCIKLPQSMMYRMGELMCTSDTTGPLTASGFLNGLYTSTSTLGGSSAVLAWLSCG